MKKEVSLTFKNIKYKRNIKIDEYIYISACVYFLWRVRADFRYGRVTDITGAFDIMYSNWVRTSKKVLEVNSKLGEK